MRKIILFLLCFILTITSQLSVQALDWAYPFVVWKGNVYEVTDEEVFDIGGVIGKVKRGINDMTGEYFGDASNLYPKGTKYYEIKGISPQKAIAVEVEKHEWKKAVFIYESPNHRTEIDIHLLIFAVLIVAVIMAMLRINHKKRKV